MHISASMRLMGVFALEFAGEPVNITSSRAQSLLAYLALHRDKPQSRKHLAFLLWSDSTELQAFTNLRTLLHRTNKVLSGKLSLITTDSTTVMWNSDIDLEIDVYQFLSEIERANTLFQTDDQGALEALQHAVSLYHGDFLSECYDEWIEIKRDSLRSSLQTAINQLVKLLENKRQYASAIPYARRAVHLDLLNEATHLTLMRLHSMNNDRASALRVYHECVTQLKSELGVSPGSLLTDMYESLIASETNLMLISDRGSPSLLIGREQEWKRIQSIWQVVNAGRTYLLTISGEAGIGKTRFAEEFLKWAKHHKSATAVTRCYYAEGELAYAPVRTLIQEEIFRRELDHLSAEWLLEIARIAPSVTRVHLPSEMPAKVTASWQRQRLFESLAHLILKPKSPIVILIDDLQWCDQETLEWLHFLIRFDPTSRLLVIATVREEEVNPEHPIINLLAATRREGRLAEILLNRLSFSETMTLAEHITETSMKSIDADNLYADTEGNPLFIVEILRSKLKSGTPDSTAPTEDQASTQHKKTHSDLPETILTVIQRRLSNLSENTRILLNIASVVGRSFSYDIIKYATDLSEDDLVQGLDELWQKHILREQGSDEYDFSHGKLRSVTYEHLSVARRRFLHRRVARALEVVYASDLDSMSGRIAVHYEESHDLDAAIKYYQKAGNHARYLFANENAINYYHRAIKLLDEHEINKKIELHNQLAELYHFTGQYEIARHHWEIIIEHIPDDDSLLRARVYCNIGNAWRDQHNYDEALDAYDIAEQALKKESGDNEAVQLCWGEIKLERVNVFYWLGKVDEMLTALQEIKDIFEQSGASKQQARLHQISGITLLRKNRYTSSLKVLEHQRKFLNLVQQIDDNAVPSAHFQMGFVYLWADNNLHQAEEHMGTALGLAQKRGDVSLEVRCLTYLTVIKRLQGDFQNTKQFAERSLSIATAGSSYMWDYVGAAHGNLAWVAWQENDKELAKSHTIEALAAWQKHNTVYMFEWIGRLLLIEMNISEGNYDKAIEQIPHLLNDGQKQLPNDVEANFLAAIRFQNEDDGTKIRAHLNAAIKVARTYGYL